MENLVIRKMKAEDAEDVEYIYNSIMHESERINFHRMIEEQSKTSSVTGLVAEFEGSVVGYMISYTVSGSFGVDKSAWIAMIGVSPDHMGTGVGKRLAEKTFQFYHDQGIKNVYTSVLWDSTDLLSFFKTLKFDRSPFINLKKVLD